MPRLTCLLLPFILAGCQEGGAVHARARALIAANCGACHLVPGVAVARGAVGPSLRGIASRGTIAGRYQNTPANLRAFISHAQQMMPGGAMPDLDLPPDQAAAIADYLYTLDRP